MPMKCKNCGATLDEGALFCRKCGTAAPERTEPQKPERKTPAFIKRAADGLKQAGAWTAARFSALKRAKVWKNKRFLLVCGVSLALLIALIVLIVSVASCGAKQKDAFKTSDELVAAAIDALERGDGQRLRTLASVSEPLLGLHPELYGEGDTPQAVMTGYYTRLADGFYERMYGRFGSGFRLETQTETQTKTGSEIFEANRSLGIEADEYISVSVTFSVDGEVVADTEAAIIAAHLDGEWKLIVLYLY